MAVVFSLICVASANARLLQVDVRDAKDLLIQKYHVSTSFIVPGRVVRVPVLEDRAWVAQVAVGKKLFHFKGSDASDQQALLLTKALSGADYFAWYCIPRDEAISLGRPRGATHPEPTGDFDVRYKPNGLMDGLVAWVGAL